jgi:hypothetical protein
VALEFFCRCPLGSALDGPSQGATVAQLWLMRLVARPGGSQPRPDPNCMTSGVNGATQRLHISQRSSMFRTVFDPPRLTAMMWSYSSRSREPQSTQRPSSRLQTSRRTATGIASRRETTARLTLAENPSPAKSSRSRERTIASAHPVLTSRSVRIQVDLRWWW